MERQLVAGSMADAETHIFVCQLVPASLNVARLADCPLNRLPVQFVRCVVCCTLLCGARLLGAVAAAVYALLRSGAFVWRAKVKHKHNE